MNVEKELEMNWRQITCKRGVGGAAFSQGVQDFDFSVSGKNAWIPGYSYFRAECKFNGPAADIPLQLKDNIAPANDFGACLYNNAFFRAGNQDVSMITQYVPQASALKTRLDTSGSWIKYVGRDYTLNDLNFNRRQQKIAMDGAISDDSLQTLYTGTVETIAFTIADYNVVITPNAGFNFDQIGVSVGDTLQLNTGGHRTFVFTNRVSATQWLVNTPETFPVVANLALAARAWTIKKRSDNTDGRSSLFVMFRPPIGIMDVYNAIGGGDFKIQLNPNPNYKVAAVESFMSDKLSNADYDLTIVDVQLYICTIKKDISPVGTIPLSLTELQVINKPISVASGQLDFTVPPSTYALSVFIQSGAAGTATSKSPTIFKGDRVNPMSTSVDLQIQSIQVTYGSVTKPATLYGSSYSDKQLDPAGVPGIDKMQQRWLETQLHAGKLTKESGTESYQDWLRSPYLHFDFSRDKNDSSSYVNVFLTLANAPPANTQLFLVAHYSRQVDIQYENGYIVQVTSANR